MKVIYVPVKYEEKLKLWRFPSAGPNPSISGMRKIYGKDSFLIKSGSYLYNVDSKTYYTALNSVCDY